MIRLEVPARRPASVASPRPFAEREGYFAGGRPGPVPFPRSRDEADQPQLAQPAVDLREAANLADSQRPSCDRRGGEVIVRTAGLQRMAHVARRSSSRRHSQQGRRSSSKAAWASTHLQGTFPGDKVRVKVADDIFDLDVSQNCISDLNGSRLIAWLPQLRTVCLAGNLLTNVTSVLPLAALPHLQSLDVSDNPCQPPGGRVVLLALLLVPLLAEARRAADSERKGGGLSSGAAGTASPAGAGGLRRPASAPQLDPASSRALRPPRATRPALAPGCDPVLAETVDCARAHLTCLRELGARARNGARDEWRPSHVVELLAKGLAYLPAASAYKTPISDKACGRGKAAGSNGHFPKLVVLDGEDIFVHTLEGAAETAGQLLLDGAAPVAGAARKQSHAIGSRDLHRGSQEHIKEFHSRFRREIRDFHRRLEDRDLEKRRVARNLSTLGVEVPEDPIEFNLGDIALPPCSSITAPAPPIAASAEGRRVAADGEETPDGGPPEDDERTFRAMETQLWAQLRFDELRLQLPAELTPKDSGPPAAPRNEAWEEHLAASRHAAATSAKLPEWLDNFVRVPVPFDVREVQERNRATEAACDTASTEALASAVSAAFSADPRGHGRAAPAGGGQAAAPSTGPTRHRSQRLAKKLGLTTDISDEPEVLRLLRARGIHGIDRRSSVALQQRLQQLAEDYPEEFMTATVDEHPTLFQSSLWVLDLHESPTSSDGWHLRSVRLTEGGYLWVGPELGKEGQPKLHLGGQSVMNLQVQRCRQGVEAVSCLRGLRVFPFRIDLLTGREKRAKYFAATSAQMCDDWMRACRGLLHSEAELLGSVSAE